MQSNRHLLSLEFPHRARARRIIRAFHEGASHQDAAERNGVTTHRAEQIVRQAKRRARELILAWKYQAYRENHPRWRSEE